MYRCACVCVSIVPPYPHNETECNGTYIIVILCKLDGKSPSKPNILPMFHYCRDSSCSNCCRLCNNKQTNYAIIMLI